MTPIEELLAVAADPAYVRVVTAKIPLVSQALRDEHAQLDARLAELIKTRDTVDIPPEQIEIADRLKAIEDEMGSATREFRFRCIGYRPWLALVAKHPPTKAQLDAAKQTGQRPLDHNPETFPFAAIAASCTDPVMTAEQVMQFADSGLMDGKMWTALWDACLRANVADDDPKSVAAGLILRLNSGSARRHTTTGSHAASSSDE
jgi:hypothetical protein